MKLIFTGKRPFLFFPIMLITLFSYSRLQTQNSVLYPDRPLPETQGVLEPVAAITTTMTSLVPTWDVAARAQVPPGTPAAISSIPDQSQLVSVPKTANIPTIIPTPTSPTPAAGFASSEASNGPLPSLEAFARQVANGKAGDLAGLYVQGLMALKIVQQPAGDPGYTSQEDGTATQFQNAAAYGVVGLLAHNFLSGRKFFNLDQGQELDLIYGDGSLKRFRVSQIADFQRLTLSDLRSNFLELKSNQEWTVDQVFAKFYQGSPHLTLQTCIEHNGVWNWGVRFVVAEPLQP